MPRFGNINYPSHILGSLSVEEFLTQYWQQKPVLIRNAWPNIDPHMTPEELAGLALEEGVESRIILERDGNRPWELRQSPFDESSFTSLPETHWSLLVNDVEKHIPAFRAFLKPFSFIPNWRIDDLMISYAPAHGSVGPHIDQYDVFLLQTHGHRRWQISTQQDDPNNRLEGTDLSILKDFSPEEDWILAPGDMLYLPPGVAHHGVAQGRCMTYSIGFRAPTDTQLLDHFIDYCYAAEQPATRYSDPKRELTTDARQIAEQDVEHLREMMLSLINDNDERFRHWLGMTLSAPRKVYDEPLAALDELALHAWISIKPSATITALPSSSATNSDAKHVNWYIDGQPIVLSQHQATPNAQMDRLLDHHPIQLDQHLLDNYQDDLQALLASELLYSALDTGSA